MIKLKKIFVVINPASNDQYALKRAAEIAALSKAELIAHLCIYSGIETYSQDELKEAEFTRHQLWLKNIIQPYKDQGLKIRIELAWDSNWQKELGKAARKEHPDLIVKASRRSPKLRKVKMLSSDWAMFESAPCPVLLVNAAVKRTNRILVAIDINREDKKYQAIMEQVIEHAKSVEAATGSELHVINSYVDQDDYVHVTDVAKIAGVPSSQVHVRGGHPEQAIVDTANKIEAEMVIMGISSKSKLANRIFGYTSEWLLNNLNQDVYVIIPKAS